MVTKVKKSSTKKVSSNKNNQFRVQMKRLFKDKIFRWFLIVSLTFVIGILGILAARLRPIDFAVPLHYSTFQGFDGLGAWYRIYIFGIFALMVTAGNFVLAAYSYDKSRIASFFLVMGSTIINLFLLIIVFTLTNNLEV